MDALKHPMGLSLAPIDRTSSEEEIALLSALQSRSLSVETVGPGPGSEADAAPHAFKSELWRILKLAGPLAFQHTLIMLQSAIITAAVGHLDAASLSAMVLFVTAYNVSGLSLVMGAASGAETLSGQCFGAKNYGAVGTILQRSLLINWLVTGVVFLLWTQVHRVLTATGQDPVLAARAVALMWQSAPALVSTGTTECLKRYLMAQGVVVPTCVVYIGCTLLTPLVAWAAIFPLGLGLPGAAVALNLISVLNCGALLSYVLLRNRRMAGSGRETWQGWSREAFNRWGEYLSLAVPSTVMMCLEWWTWEALIMMTGELKNAALNLGTMGVMFQIGGLCYMPPMGLQGAASTRVSNELGEGKPRAAKTAYRAAMLLGFVCQTTIAGVVYLGRAQWGRAFSGEPKIVQGVASMLPILTVMMPLDGMNAVCSGVVRGCGRQLLAATLNVFTFWGMGLPLAAYLAFRTSLEVKGLWVALCMVTYVQFFAITTLISCLDWSSEAKRAANLVSSNKLRDGDHEGKNMA